MIYAIINECNKKYTQKLVYNEQSVAPIVILDPVTLIFICLFSNSVS